MGKRLTLVIDSLALGGAGVARMPEGVLEGAAGMAVFVERALPGSTVQARITRAHRRHAEAVAEEVLLPSPDAVEPFCPHFGVCGGCLLQDLDYARQVEWKERQMLDALRRIGKVEPGQVLPALPAPRATRFRNKMQFAFQGQGQELRLGLHKRGAPGSVLGLSACHLLPQTAEAVLLHAGQLFRQSGLAAYDRSNPGGGGLLRHLIIRYAEAQGKILAQCLTAKSGEAEARAVRGVGEALQAAHPALAGFVHAERFSADGLAQAERTVCVLGDTTLEERLGPVRYRISADAFFQTNTGAAEALYASLAGLIDLAGGETLYDLYCGSGGIGLFLASQAGRVLGLEMSAAAIADAVANAELNGITNCRFLRAELAGHEPIPSGLPAEFAQPDAVVCDPPREGLDSGVVRWLLKARPGRLAYVSCNASTLARDAGLLAEGYDLAAVRCVDLFPHTAHAECLALFLPKS